MFEQIFNRMGQITNLSNVEKTERIAYYDVAKGLLILMLLWQHIPQIGLYWCQFDMPILHQLNQINSRTFVPFFMTGFFLISGVFLNQEKPLYKTILHDAQTLLLPAVLLSLISNTMYSLWEGNFDRFQQYTQWDYWTQTCLLYWFLFSLFFAKILAQLIIRYIPSTKYRVVVALLICIVGVLLKKGIIPWHNYFRYQEALTFVPFVCAGYAIREHQIDIKELWLMAIGYVVTIALLYINQCKISGFNLGIGFSLDYLPMALWLGLSGSALTLVTSYLLCSSKVLATIGKLSLPIFCFNFFFLQFFLTTFHQHFSGICFVLLVFLCSTLSCTLVSALLQTKYLKWLLGR